MRSSEAFASSKFGRKNRTGARTTGNGETSNFWSPSLMIVGACPRKAIIHARRLRGNVMQCSGLSRSAWEIQNGKGGAGKILVIVRKLKRGIPLPRLSGAPTGPRKFLHCTTTFFMLSQSSTDVEDRVASHTPHPPPDRVSVALSLIAAPLFLFFFGKTITTQRQQQQHHDAD